MKLRYHMLHIPQHIRNMLSKQDALIPHHGLLDQRRQARLALGRSDLLCKSDWRFVPSSLEIQWNSFSLAALKQFHIKLGQGAFVCDPVTFVERYPQHSAYWLYKQRQTARVYPSLESALVRSFWNRGIILFIPDTVTMLQPIELGEHLATLGIVLEDITIVIGKNSSAQIRCQRSSLGKGARYTLRSLTVLLDDHAVLDLHSDEQFSSGSSYITESYYELQRDAYLNFLFVQTGGGFNKQRHEVVLAGSGAQADVRGISGAGNRGHHDIVTCQTHTAPHTKSKVAIRSIVGGKARTAYQGLVHISASARGADASQEHKSIVLNAHARSWSIPSLEVLTSDVTCSHASAIGPLEEEQIIYLRSRGIPLPKIRELLLNAFLHDLLSGSPFTTYSNDITARVITSASVGGVKAL